MANLYNQTVKEILEDFKTDPDKGLSSHEVASRQKKYGKNVLNVKTTPLWRKILEPFIDVFMAILIVALILSAIQKEWVEVILIAVIIAINAIIYYAQQISTDRILKSLKEQTVQSILVIRNGEESEIDASELVPGDIVVLKEGDRLPADGRIIVESGILTNESMLTGESEPIAKDARAISGELEVYEQRNMVFAGSFIFTGSGKMLVTATGNNTEYGHIASLASSTDTKSPIQEKINSLVIKIAIVVVIIAAIIFVVQLLQGVYPVRALEFTLAMIVSAVPESLLIATSIVMTLGARRMAKKKALVKEIKAIQSIGIVTTIASDKTGTLTENKLSLKEKWSPKDGSFAKVIAEATLMSADSTDPLDLAMLEYVKKHHSHLTDIGPVHSYAFDQGLKLSGNLYETKSGALHLAVKGAPESILKHCKITDKMREEAEAKILDFTSRGYKVIGLATCKLKHEINELNRLTKDDEFEFEGLIAIADSVRKEAPAAIKQANAAGVKVKMVTGDHARTAFAIGKELGLATDFEQVLDCSKMGSITDEDLAEKVKTTTIFARVTPEDKFRILTAIKKNEVSAMTGDGVNDVPALTNAHIGIAMGDSPSIVQDAGDIVLLDNNFKNIIEAMKEGRIVLTNIRRMLIYLLATNAGEVLTILGALFINGTQPLLPIQILWINLVTDSLMVIPIGLEPAEKRILRSKPEAKDAPILSLNLIVRMALISVTMATITLTTFFVSQNLFSYEEANTLAFAALVAMQWGSAFAIRGIYESIWKRLKAKNINFYFALSVAIILQLLALFGPLTGLVHTVPVPILAFIVVVVVSFILPIVVVEIHKKFSKHKN